LGQILSEAEEDEAGPLEPLKNLGLKFRRCAAPPQENEPQGTGKKKRLVGFGS